MEELLQERKTLLETMEIQEDEIMRLDAYKKTFIKCLCGDELIHSFPTDFKFDENEKISEFNDGPFPLFVLNFGILPPGKDINTGFPLNFKCLRQFNRPDSMRSTADYNGYRATRTWYNTTVLKKKGMYFFVIKDDENNTWRGKDAFSEFSKSFGHDIPFKSMRDWLGLNNEDVKMHYFSSE